MIPNKGHPEATERNLIVLLPKNQRHAQAARNNTAGRKYFNSDGIRGTG
jgi:hypothetical protein